MVRAKTGKSRQQAMVQIDDSSAGKLPAGLSGQYPHVPGEHDIIDIEFVKNGGHGVIVSHASVIADRSDVW